MKFGIKVYKYTKELEEFENLADFIEVMAIEKGDYSFFKNLKIPVIIHSQHQIFGVNNADPVKREKNLSSINFARKLADMTGAKKIILHPGQVNNENCSEKEAVDFIKILDDKRIIIENLPARGGSLCTIPEETERFMKLTEKGLCFDINHAIETCIYLKKDYLQMIKEFLMLKPKHYHIGGQKLDGSSHLNFSESEVDLKKIIMIKTQTSRTQLIKPI